MGHRKVVLISTIGILVAIGTLGQSPNTVRNAYTKAEYRIVMRDGLPIAIMAAGQIVGLEADSNVADPAVERALRIGSMPASLRPYYA